MLAKSDRSVAVGILLYQGDGNPRDAFGEEKYRALASAMAREGWVVRTLNYQESLCETVRRQALECAAVLVWINPIEPGLDRSRLDEFLRSIAAAGVQVSAHPDAILKIGTKEVLVETQSLGWTVEANAYRSPEQMMLKLPALIRRDGSRVVKQYRGNGGQGVWKISHDKTGAFLVQSAVRAQAAVLMNEEQLEVFFRRTVFDPGSYLIDQAWVPTMTRGVVRAYLCGTRVAGFGYQEINALYPATAANEESIPSQRHYYTEHCFLFQDLRELLENRWVPALGKCVGLAQEAFPLLWDADFFFADPPQHYVLCEINASCVSPFPPSAIEPVVRELSRRLDRT